MDAERRVKRAEPMPSDSGARPSFKVSNNYFVFMFRCVYIYIYRERCLLKIRSYSCYYLKRVYSIAAPGEAAKDPCAQETPCSKVGHDRTKLAEICRYGSDRDKDSD